MSRLLLLAAACGMLLAAGCTRWGVGKPQALIYQNTTTPMWLVRAPDGPPERVGDPAGSRTIPDDAIPFRALSTFTLPPNAIEGRSRSHKIGLQIPGIPLSSRLFSVGWGDSSLEKAIADGNLQRLSFADAQEIEILGIYHKVVMKAWGPPNEEPPPHTP